MKVYVDGGTATLYDIQSATKKDMSKSEKLGLPIALIIYDQELDVWAPGAHTGTFRGNQLAFATGVEAVKIIKRDDILGNVVRRSEQCMELLAPLQRHPWVREIRGKGLLLGIELINVVGVNVLTTAVESIREQIRLVPGA